MRLFVCVVWAGIIALAGWVAAVAYFGETWVVPLLWFPLMCLCFLTGALVGVDWENKGAK